MRILVISYYYHPASNPRAFRWTAICEHLAKQGVIVDVLCASSASDLLLLNQTCGINVYGSSDPFNKIRMSQSVATRSLSLTHAWEIKIKRFILSGLKKIVRSLRWPDYAWFWILPARRQAIQLLKMQAYDGVISVSMPFSAHVVVWILGRKRKNIPWICDYGDPFSFMKELPVNNRWFYCWLNKWVERCINKESQKISVTTKEAADEQVQYLGVSKQWLHVIPPLVKRSFCCAPYLENRDVKNRPIQLVFAGTLYEKIRNPKYCLRLLSIVRKRMFPRLLMIHFYGELIECMQEFLPYMNNGDEWVFLHGPVKQSELKSIYEAADILVNIGNATSYQVPSKVIEYMSTGIPILNITSIGRDSSIPLLQSYPAKFSHSQCVDISDEIIQALCDFFANSARVDMDIVNEILKKYQVEEISNKYLRLLMA